MSIDGKTTDNPNKQKSRHQKSSTPIWEDDVFSAANDGGCRIILFNEHCPWCKNPLGEDLGQRKFCEED